MGLGRDCQSASGAPVRRVSGDRPAIWEGLRKRKSLIIVIVTVVNSVYMYMHSRIYTGVGYMQVSEKKVGICKFGYMQV